MILAEIARQCRFALKAYGAAAAAAARLDDDDLWPAIDALLGAAARLHQLLWPPREDSAEWPAALRSTLAIGPDSPLHRSEWQAIGDLAALVDEWSRRPAGAVRKFDREHAAVRYYGLTFELAPLLAAIAGLETRAVSEARQMRQMV